MKVKIIPSSWITREGRRLDCGPYMSGALEAKILLERLPVAKVKLQDLTEGGAEGIINAGRIRRVWVTDPAYGVPFLSSSDILQADLSTLPLISKRVVAENPKLLIKKGWTLITRSGTIGRMTYARADMENMGCSEHVMRVLPDPAKVPSGYLYAYLSSKFGVPQVVSGTYGSIIQSIEPHHIADLPVPRLGAAVEQRAHTLVEEAAQLRTFAANTVRKVAEYFDALISDLTLKAKSPRIGEVLASRIQHRFDAQFHDPIVESIRKRLSSHHYTTIAEWCNRIFLPGIFKRVYVENSAYGAPYYTGASLFWLEPQSKGVLSRKTTLFDEVFLEYGTILVQAFGQDGGLTGRSVWVGKHLAGSTTTHMLVRLTTTDLIRTAYLYGFLQSEAAYKQIACLTYGGSIPHLDEKGIGTVIIPLFNDNKIEEIGNAVLQAMNARDNALSCELQARALVEQAIEEAT